MCNNYPDIGPIKNEVVERSVGKEKSRLLFLVDKSSTQGGLETNEFNEALKLIENTPETKEKCKFFNDGRIHGNSIEDTRLCRSCLSYRFNSYLGAEKFE